MLAVHTSAQKKDNLGKEYYLAFGPNGGSTENENVFALYLTGPVAASVTIEVSALSFAQECNVTPGQVTKVLLPNGANFGPTVEVTTSDTVVKGMGVHIIANTEIGVYGMSHKTYSSDAFMALPIDVLGTKYRTLNYQSSLVSFGGQFADLPGQFWVVASEDQTLIVITPNDTTSSGRPARESFVVLLNKGDVYLVQGNPHQKGNDLTGSLIESDKPIAVFSGHMRAAIPEGFNNTGTNRPSRDHLVEQLPPISSWGSEMVVVPYESSDSPDVVRILSATDSNAILINNDFTVGLNAGEFYEIHSLYEPTLIRSLDPVLVGQYMHTSVYGIASQPNDPAPYGDPSFSLVPPLVQASGTQFVVVVGDAATIEAQFLTIVSKADSLVNLRVNDRAISSSNIKTIGTSEYGYATLPVLSGVHAISLNTPYSVNVYGLGAVDSYAYGVWLLTEPLNSVRDPVNEEHELLTFGDIFPNPIGRSQNGVILPFYANISLALSWSVHSVEGVMYEQGGMNVVAGKGQISVSTSNELPNGTYFLDILAEKQGSSITGRYTGKFVVIR
ncbi:MAG TPA: IgGFc-binding protein [Candidatus Kapabacteria bacterium]